MQKYSNISLEEAKITKICSIFHEDHEAIAFLHLEVLVQGTHVSVASSSLNQIVA